MRWERWHPLGVGLATAVALFVACPRMGMRALPASSHELLTAAISLFAITAGYVATAKSVLFALGDRPVIRELQEAGTEERDYWGDLVDFMLAAVNWSMFAALLSAVALMFDARGPLGTWRLAVASGWVGVVTAALLSVHRVARLYATILRRTKFSKPQR